MEAGTETTAMRSPASENGESGEGARAKAEEVAGKAQEQVGTAKDKARVQLRDQVDQRSTQAGERVRSAAGDARSVAEELRKQGSETPARYAEQAADQVERVGDWLRDSDGDRILGDVEDFARRNPWGVAVAGLALGFVAARMLKASSAERYERTTGARPPLPSTGARVGP
jgi:ElaB/YqjD/DUF883 family membrane-anchored ribosome-binding protein